MDEAKLQERLAVLEQAVAKSLELFERGRSDEARTLLTGVADPLASAPEPGITDAELERAFATAESETDHMHHADDVAQQAILQADLALEAEGEMAPDEVGDHFATETMAQLLEKQGDAPGAGRIRAALDAHDRSAVAGRPSRRETVATLERWLDNLRGGART